MSVPRFIAHNSGYYSPRVGMDVTNEWSLQINAFGFNNDLLHNHVLVFFCLTSLRRTTNLFCYLCLLDVFYIIQRMSEGSWRARSTEDWSRVQHAFSRSETRPITSAEPSPILYQGSHALQVPMPYLREHVEGKIPIIESKPNKQFWYTRNPPTRLQTILLRWAT